MISKPSSSEYENLEKITQKYENQIREHISIEQQLKLWSDSMQSEQEEKEKELAKQIEELKVHNSEFIGTEPEAAD